MKIYKKPSRLFVLLIILLIIIAGVSYSLYDANRLYDVKNQRNRQRNSARILGEYSRSLEEQRLKRMCKTKTNEFVSCQFYTAGTNMALDYCSRYVAPANRVGCIISRYGKKSRHILVLNSLRLSLSDKANATNFESQIIAHEKLHLWPDDTVAVYFDGLGAIRMKTDDFVDVMSGKETRLFYDKKRHCWTR